MHFLYCIVAGLIVCVVGLVFLAVSSNEKDPEDKEKTESKVIDLDESLRESIRYDWREKENVN